MSAVAANCQNVLGILNYCLLTLSITFDIGKRVIHSDMTDKKLIEVKKALNNDSMVIIIDFFIFLPDRMSEPSSNTLY